MLSDVEILREIGEGNIRVEPFVRSQMKSNTYVFRLSEKLLELAPGQTIDLNDKTAPEYVEVQIPKSGYILPSKGFVLASSIEKISTSRSISVLVDGISALSRIGLSIHQSDMHCKPGQDFYTVTLEMFNAGNSEIILRPGINIGKFLFIKSQEENSNDYKSKYMQKDGPKGARFD